MLAAPGGLKLTPVLTLVLKVTNVLKVGSSTLVWAQELWEGGLRPDPASFVKDALKAPRTPTCGNWQRPGASEEEPSRWISPGAQSARAAGLRPAGEL